MSAPCQGLGCSPHPQDTLCAAQETEWDHSSKPRMNANRMLCRSHSASFGAEHLTLSAGLGHTQRQPRCSRSPGPPFHRSRAGGVRGALVRAGPGPLALRAWHCCFPGELAWCVHAQAMAPVSPRHTSSPGDTSGPGRSGGLAAPCLLVPHKEIHSGHVRVHTALCLRPQPRPAASSRVPPVAHCACFH